MLKTFIYSEKATKILGKPQFEKNKQRFWETYNNSVKPTDNKWGKTFKPTKLVENQNIREKLSQFWVKPKLILENLHEFHFETL